AKPASDDLSQEELERRRKQIAAAEQQMLHRFNNQYFVLSEAGKVWVGEYRLDATFKSRREVLDRFSFAAFRELYLNRSIKTVTVDKKGNPEVGLRNLAEWWLRHPQRRQYNGVVFDPSGNVPNGWLNLWRGFGVAAAPGDWSLMRDH